MASLCREPRPLRKEWGRAKCALYAARKEFELLKLLSTADEKVVAIARTMGQAAVNAPSGQDGMQQHQYDLTELVGRLLASPTVGGLMTCPVHVRVQYICIPFD